MGSKKQTIASLPSREISLEELMEDGRQQFSNGPTLDEQVQHQEEVYHLHQALCSLEREYQLLLYFRYWKDMSQEDVAKMLSLTQQAVSYRERYALQRLKDFVQNGEKKKF